MLTSRNLYEIAKSRFDEAIILLENNKPDGAAYLCGYAVELMLKRQIVITLDWDGFPENKSEFENYGAVKIHSLDILLKFSGVEKKVISDTETFARWQIIKSRWNSDIRYKKIGSLSKEEAQRIIDATRETLNFILRI